jgi:hypothetical protein
MDVDVPALGGAMTAPARAAINTWLSGLRETGTGLSSRR